GDHGTPRVAREGGRTQYPTRRKVPGSVASQAGSRPQETCGPGVIKDRLTRKCGSVSFLRRTQGAKSCPCNNLLVHATSSRLTGRGGMHKQVIAGTGFG